MPGAPWGGFSGKGQAPGCSAGWSWLPAPVSGPSSLLPHRAWGTGAMIVPSPQPGGPRTAGITQRASETTNRTAVRATSAPFPLGQTGRVSCTPGGMCACLWHGHLCMIHACACVYLHVHGGRVSTCMVGAQVCMVGVHRCEYMVWARMRARGCTRSPLYLLLCHTAVTQPPRPVQGSHF